MPAEAPAAAPEVAPEPEPEPEPEPREPVFKLKKEQPSLTATSEFLKAASKSRSVGPTGAAEDYVWGDGAKAKAKAAAPEAAAWDDLAGNLAAKYD